MRKCRVPAVIIAAVIGGAGLTACAASGSTPSAVASAAASGGSATALSGSVAADVRAYQHTGVGPGDLAGPHAFRCR